MLAPTGFDLCEIQARASSWRLCLWSIACGRNTYWLSQRVSLGCRRLPGHESDGDRSWRPGF